MSTPCLRRLNRLLIASLVLWVATAGAGEAASSSLRQPRVLVLYSNQRLLPAGIAVDEAIRATFETGLEVPVEFYAEFLDVDRFPSVTQQERMREFLSEKYQERTPDVIIAGGGSALNFLVRHRANLFSRVPVVHCGVSRRSLPGSMPDDLIVGIPHAVDLAATLEIALRLQPDTRHVAVVGGGDAGGSVLTASGKAVEFLWLTNQVIGELRDALSRLPDHTVVLYGSLFHDSAGNAFTPRTALEQIAPASRAPIYGHYDTYLGHGIVGGSMITYQIVGGSAAQTAIRILQGERPQDAVRGVSHTPTPMFDWRELRRWSISESRLPPGAQVLFREPTLWERHKWLILGILLVTSAETVLIILLVISRIRRRRIEHLLRQSEYRLRLAAEAAGAGLWGLDLATNVFWLTDQTRKLFGFSETETITVERFLAVVHPEDRGLLQQRLSELNESRGCSSVTFRIVGPDGTIRWIASRRSLQCDASGRPQALTGVSTDITEQQRNADEIQRLQTEAWHADRVVRTGAITSSLAHELNQPLAAMLSAAQAGLRFMAAETHDPQEIRDILQNIVQDTKRAGAVVSGLRAMVRRQASQRERVNVAEVVQATLDLLHSELLTHRVRLDVQCQPNCCVQADKTQIQQVILNLTMNAIEAMQRLPHEARRIEIAAGRDGAETVRLSVADSGFGIPPEETPRLFEAFWTTKAQGLGIGLAICRSIIESHRGRIWLASNEPGRTTFSFSLPLDSHA